MSFTLDTFAEAWWSASDQQGRDALASRLAADAGLRSEMHRGALAPERVTDERSLRRLLALCDIHYRRDDTRDVIVTLVLLRHAAEKLKIDAVLSLREAEKLACPELRPCFTSAISHTDAEVLHTAAAFGKQ